MLKTIDEYSDYFLLIDDFFITGVIAEKAGINRFDNSLIRKSSCSDLDVCLIQNKTPIDMCPSSNIPDVWSKFKKFSRIKNISVEYCLTLTSSRTSPDHVVVVVVIIFIAYDIYQLFS